MSNLPIFSHPSFGTVRIVERNDEPWFVAKDVAKALGYASTNMTTIFQAVPEEWKGSNPITTLGGEQEMLIISEQGLYFFLGRSDKPVALPFQKWLAGKVVPAIRKTGGYMAAKPDDTPESIMPEKIGAQAVDMGHLRGIRVSSPDGNPSCRGVARRLPCMKGGLPMMKFTRTAAAYAVGIYLATGWRSGWNPGEWPQREWGTAAVALVVVMAATVAWRWWRGRR